MATHPRCRVPPDQDRRRASGIVRRRRQRHRADRQEFGRAAGDEGVTVGGSATLEAVSLHGQPASFDGLRMREKLAWHLSMASYHLPHPELVEGRTVLIQRDV